MINLHGYGPSIFYGGIYFAMLFSMLGVIHYRKYRKYKIRSKTATHLLMMIDENDRAGYLYSGGLVKSVRDYLTELDREINYVK